jgi:hypothetical protein
VLDKRTPRGYIGYINKHTRKEKKMEKHKLRFSIENPVKRLKQELGKEETIKLLDQAKDIGSAAFKAGKKCIPAHDEEYLKLIKPSFKMGMYVPLAEMWTKGWHAENLK